MWEHYSIASKLNKEEGEVQDYCVAYRDWS